MRSIQRYRRVIIAVQFVLLLGVRSAGAQSTSDPTLSELIPNLLIETAKRNVQVFDELFGIDVSAEAARDLVNLTFGLVPGISSQLSSFPLGSSAGGFSWTFDPALGTFNRVSDSFGPVFAERALTVGRGRINLGVNFQRSTFDKFEDTDLDDGIKLYTGFPELFVQDSLHLKLATNVVGIFATYGVTDRLDVGVAVPVVHAEVEARIVSRVGTVAQLNPPVFTSEPTKGSATGIGDVVIRGKYNFWRAAGGGIAAGIDLRVPTGDEVNLLGVAGMQAKLYAALSSAHGRLSPHLNFGYTISAESDAAKDLDTYLLAPSDEFNYAGGVDVAITPRLTVASDIVGRNMRDFIQAVPVPAGGGSLFTTFDIEETNLNQLLGSVGVKFNPFGQSLIAVNVLFPLDDHGLRDNLTWLVGFEHSFALKSK